MDEISAIPQSPPAAIGNSRVTIRIGGAEHVFEMERCGRAIIDVAARRGIELPMQCHVGWCCECRAVLRRGQVRMSELNSLTRAERLAGLVLACCSTPLSKEVFLDFDVAREPEVGR